MLGIQDKLVSEDLLEESFVCDLNACKGACCVEGDTGAPLDIDELPILDDIYEAVKPYLTAEGIAVLDKARYVWEPDDEKWKTPLINGGPCAWINYDNGVAVCGIEKAFLDGKVDWQKPVSCHLYPVRIKKWRGVESVHYERWQICKAACKNGQKLKVPVFKFVKTALVRKYGPEFYNILEAYYAEMHRK